ncbi:MAG TPA: hypothetical protein VG890_12875, partial [Puia sp.]|nr:hypothetical protein [Puia sp.]
MKNKSCITESPLALRRRDFLFRSGLALSAWLLPFDLPSFADKQDRIAMGTLIMRYRFAQTKPKELTVLRDELVLADVPHYYRERFNVKKIEFWSEHFESFDKDYLLHIRDQIKAAGCHLLDVQLDSAP